MADKRASRTAWLLAVFFGAGLSPVAPGTAGSLAAIVLAWLMAHYAGWGQTHFIILSLAALGPAVWAAHRAASGSRDKDPGWVVIDEVAGQWVAVAGLSVYNWKSLLAAFLLFRLLDILKPPPVRWLERIPGGAGIVADDVAAGAIAALVLFMAGCFNLY